MNMYLECEACGLVVKPLDGDGKHGRAERLSDLCGLRPPHEVVDGPEVPPLHLVLLRLGPRLAHHLGLRAALPLPRHVQRLFLDKPKTFSEPIYIPCSEQERGELQSVERVLPDFGSSENLLILLGNAKQEQQEQEQVRTAQ